MAGEFVEYDDLIGIHASQAVGRQTPHALEVAGLRSIAQGVQTGTVQARTGETVIDVFCERFMSFLGHALTQ